MVYDEVQILIFLTDATGIATGDGALVEGMPDADAGHQRRTTDASQRRQLVNNTGVGDKGSAFGQFAICYLFLAIDFFGNLVGKQAT